MKDKIQKSKANSALNFNWFTTQAAILDLQVCMFNQGRHLRAIGRDDAFVDYWPSTGKWWKGRGKGSKDKERLSNALWAISRIKKSLNEMAHMHEITQ